MAWHETITQMTTTTTTHADNFNAVHGELLENDKDLNSKITALSNDKVDKNTNNALTKGLTINQWLTIIGDAGGKANFLSNLYRDNAGNYRYANSHATGTGCGFVASIFERKPKFVIASGNAVKDSVANTTEFELATTEKFDIALPLVSGLIKNETPTPWVTKIVKNGDGSYDLWFSVKKSDGNAFAMNWIALAGMVDGHRPNQFYIGCGIAYKSDLDYQPVMTYVDSSRLVVYNTKGDATILFGCVRFRTS